MWEGCLQELSINMGHQVNSRIQSRISDTRSGYGKTHGDSVRKTPLSRTRIALDIVHDASEIIMRSLIESRLDQDAACMEGKIRKNRPDVRKGEIRIMRFGPGMQ